MSELFPNSGGRCGLCSEVVDDRVGQEGAGADAQDQDGHQQGGDRLLLLSHLAD